MISVVEGRCGKEVLAQHLIIRRWLVGLQDLQLVARAPGPLVFRRHQGCPRSAYKTLYSCMAHLSS